MIKVTCAWGDGPDVLVTFEGHNFMLYDEADKSASIYGDVKSGSFELTADEAIELSNRLLEMACDAKDMDRTYAEFVEHENKLLRVKALIDAAK